MTAGKIVVLAVALVLVFLIVIEARRVVRLTDGDE